MKLALAVDEGADRQSRPLVVLLHGFPELPSSWHHQIKPLTDAGYRVVAPFLRGYGDSPAPSEITDYTLDHLADDVAGVIEDCGEESAIVVGHDWGAITTWSTAQLRPERVRAVMALSVPFTARTRTPPVQRMRELVGDRFFYITYFQEPGVAEAELDADPEGFLLQMYASSSGTPPKGAWAEVPASTGTMRDQLRPPEVFPPWLDKAIFDGTVNTFSRTGFGPALNYYRAIDPSWAKLPHLADSPVTCPSAFVAGERDLVLAFTSTRTLAPPWVTDLRLDRRIPNSGHWVQQEAPDEVNSALLGFLETI
jgi:pimeloyl-ACP methyl ester carboxylesterase